MIAGFAIHPGKFDVRLSQVRLRLGPGDEHLLRFAVPVLFFQQARQRVVRGLVHRVDFQRVLEQLLGLARLSLLQHRHAQVVRIVGVVRSVHRGHAEMPGSLSMVAFLKGSLAEVVVQKPVRPAAPCGEYTQTKNGQDGPVHAHGAASFRKSLICELGGSSEVGASDGRFPVGPAEAEGLIRFSREVADRKQRKGVLKTKTSGLSDT